MPAFVSAMPNQGFEIARTAHLVNPCGCINFDLELHCDLRIQATSISLSQPSRCLRCLYLPVICSFVRSPRQDGLSLQNIRHRPVVCSRPQRALFAAPVEARESIAAAGCIFRDTGIGFISAGTILKRTERRPSDG